MAKKNTNVDSKREHVALTDQTSEKINRWIEQIYIKRKGIRLSRKDMVNWLISRAPATLSGAELSAIADEFYDEAKVLRQLLRDVSTARAQGQKDAGFELIVKPKRTIEHDPASEEPEL